MEASSPKAQQSRKDIAKLANINKVQVEQEKTSRKNQRSLEELYATSLKWS